MSVRNVFGACAAALVCAGAIPASAVPASFGSGSFAFSATTTTMSDLQSTNGLYILNPTSLATSSPTGDFASNSLPGTIALPNVTPILDVTLASDFNFSDPVFGSFAATSVSLLHTVNGTPVTVDFTVLGTFVPGTEWLNSGASNLTASESWLLSQTGGQGKTITMTGTFQSPGNVTPAPGPVPEPATLGLLGFGLVAAGTLRARKARAASA